METPPRRHKYLKMMKDELVKKRKKIKSLQIDNFRLRLQIKSLKEMFKHLVEQNTLYESKSQQLLVRIFRTV